MEEEVKAAAGAARVAAIVVGVKGLLLHLLKAVKVAIKVAGKVEGVKVVEVINDLKEKKLKNGSSIIITMTVVILTQSYNRPLSKTLASHSGIKNNGRTNGLTVCKKMIGGIKSTRMRDGQLRKSKMNCKNT